MPTGRRGVGPSPYPSGQESPTNGSQQTGVARPVNLHAISGCMPKELPPEKLMLLDRFVDKASWSVAVHPIPSHP